ncbi:transcription factor [Haloplanus halobius]|uniref:transcription factor n=1 Tax=Haloplanus halobius TaxID=2934938 RepID=UPI0024B14C45|nr:transcription factor [Haloplanus sp. XH21]
MHVVSTMGSGDLRRELELDSVIQALKEEFDIEANKHSNSMATVRLESGGPAFTLYRTGSYQIRGTESRQHLFDANKELLSALRGIGLEIPDTAFDHKNSVYLEDLETTVELETLAVHLGLENVEYEPEQFPGVIYRPPEPGTVNLIFASGKTIISGTIHEEIAQESAAHLRQKLASLST